MEAQDAGVTVIQLGVPGIESSSVLVQEVDRVVELDLAILRTLFWPTGASEVADDRNADRSCDVDERTGRAVQLGTEFAVRWLQEHRSEGPAVLRQGRIPEDLYLTMLRDAEVELGPLWERNNLKPPVKDGFSGTLRGHGG
jgi:hypothetical protein